MKAEEKMKRVTLAQQGGFIASLSLTHSFTL